MSFSPPGFRDMGLSSLPSSAKCSRTTHSWEQPVSRLIFSNCGGGKPSAHFVERRHQFLEVAFLGPVIRDSRAQYGKLTHPCRRDPSLSRRRHFFRESLDVVRGPA